MEHIAYKKQKDDLEGYMEVYRICVAFALLLCSIKALRYLVSFDLKMNIYYKKM